LLIKLIDLYRVAGKHLTRKLIDARWLVPERNSNGRGVVFEAQKVHRALGRLVREGLALAPLWQPLSNEPEQSKRKRGSLEIRTESCGCFFRPFGTRDRSSGVESPSWPLGQKLHPESDSAFCEIANSH
jgi:hypothetical protein